MLEFFKNILYFGIASGAIAWLIRKIIELFLDKDVEKYKNKLEKELEIHKALHLERIVVIKEIYKKLERTHRSLESLVKPLQLAGEKNEEEKQKIFADNFNNFSNYYGENRIFFQEDVAREIDDILKKYHEVWNHWGMVNDLRRDGEKYIGEWERAWDKLQQNVPDTKKELEKKFRDLLGVK